MVYHSPMVHRTQFRKLPFGAIFFYRGGATIAKKIGRRGMHIISLPAGYPLNWEFDPTSTEVLTVSPALFRYDCLEA